jgi:RNA polymerase sigma factor (sigma-70 family)
MVSNQYSDAEFISGLTRSDAHRQGYEDALYLQFAYFIDEGKRKYSLTQEDAFSCYSDAVIKLIDNIRSGVFEGRSSIKTYLYQVFNNKCVDQIRKNTTKKGAVHQAVDISDHLYTMPDDVKNIVQQLVLRTDIDQLRSKLSELGENCRKMLLWSADGFSDKEIAEMLQFKTAGVAKTSRLRCMDRLRQLYSKRKENGNP